MSNDLGRYPAPLSGRGKQRNACQRRCGKCSLREETVYEHTDLEQDTERGVEPGALFPPKPEVGSRSEGEGKIASCINKVNVFRIAT